MPLPRPRRFLITTIAAILVTTSSGPLLAVQAGNVVNSSAVAILPNGPAACRNLPISSQLVRPTSCWVTGPTSLLVAGTDPASPADGAVFILHDNTR